jgi:small subunit ribosomal protein S18
MSSSSRRPDRRPRAYRRKTCAFCVEKIEEFDYKDVGRLSRYVAGSGKIMSRRQTGTCARHQRRVAMAVKRARHMALLPFLGR